MEVEPRWKEGPKPKRAPKRLQPRSKRARDRQPERDACRAEVLARAGNECEYAVLFDEPCRYYPPDRAELEVDELRGGTAYRVTEQYDPDRCRAACPAHHDLKTLDKLPTLRRLEHWEATHGYPRRDVAPSPQTVRDVRP